ncbi:DUF4145 domain-containing protein [Shewanella sp. AS1]|uniref:DUF4145 domain-containing protein n=1 Tax=Shewanella sp. AS1 TaxID=2907626 RepID=UPI001F47575B|nr:DUF4145 domain-containing protein [Shewanella sp. AS1]MCE9680329.1 DUF4145 domain-containing protein [Shewanella sp. AS1]
MQIVIMIDVINQITAKNAHLGKGILFAATHMREDPAISLSKCRALLEDIVNSVKQAEGYGLNDRIASLNGQVSDTIVTQMHFIRKMGNIGTHAASDANKQSCAQCITCLIAVACWRYDIENTLPTFKLVEPKLVSAPPKVTLQARYFIADAIHRTWSKVAVLTSDGVLYSEYLHYMNLRVFKRDGVDFTTFKASDFRFGADEHGHGYQPLREVTREQAQAFQLTSQSNWVAGYLAKIGIR